MNSRLRKSLLDAGKALAASGLIRGTAGNFSVRTEENGESGLLLTPSGMDCSQIGIDDLVFMCFDGSCPYPGARRPTSEWRIHRDVLASRAEFGAVVHAHSPFATALACLNRDIPAFHYMIARFGGATVHCAGYATFGSQALSDAALVALSGRSACLLANHGFLVCAVDIRQAVALAREFEDLCEQYWRACCIGNPAILSDEEMAIVVEKFKTYGQAGNA